jgi:hypothetical protein
MEEHAAREIETAIGCPAAGTAGTGTFDIVIGLCDPQGMVNETAVPDASRLSGLPNREQAYLIRPVGPNRLVLGALDERGVVYASRTLCQLLESRLHGDSITIPLAIVTDWPDLQERGLWGSHQWALFDLPAMVAHKMNLVEAYDTKLRVLPTGKGSASFEFKELRELKLGAMKVIPIITHLDLMEETGLFKVLPELKAKTSRPPTGGKGRGFPCTSNPKFANVLADWMTDLAACEGVDEVCVWLSENAVQCECQSCQQASQYVQEVRATVAAWQKVREKHARFGLRILLTQGSFSTNDKVLAEIPDTVGVTYYDGGRTYDSTRRPMIYPLLEEYAAKGRWLGCYPQLIAWWRTVCPWSGPQFIKARMTEFARKKLRCVCGYAPPDAHLYDFNLTAAAEWSWNAQGRSEREFSIAYATRRGLSDPEAFADWTETLGPVSWDVYGSDVPFPAFFGDTANRIAKRLAPRLGEGIFRYFPEPQQFDRDLAAAHRALAIARNLNDEGSLQETLVVRGYIEMLVEVYHISRIAAGNDPIGDARASELRLGLTRLAEAGQRTAAALEAWEKSVQPGMGGERFHDTLNVTRDLAGAIGKALQPRLDIRPAPDSAPANSGDSPSQPARGD